MYKVYWTDELGNPQAEEFDCIDIALSTAKNLRDDGRFTHVTMSCENPDLVGKQGVDSIENGLLPNGDKYTWKKRRR